MLSKVLNRLGSDYQFLMKKEFGQVRVTIKFLRTGETNSQVIPTEHLEDNHIIECIDFCIKKLKEKQNG